MNLILKNEYKKARVTYDPITYLTQLQHLQLYLISIMDYKCTSRVPDLEERVQRAILAYKNKEFTSVRAAITHFQIFDCNMTCYMTGGLSRAQATEMIQILLDAKEKTLI